MLVVQLLVHTAAMERKHIHKMREHMLLGERERERERERCLLSLGYVILGLRKIRHFYNPSN